MIAVENLDFRYDGSDFRLRIPQLVIQPGAKAAPVFQEFELLDY